MIPENINRGHIIKAIEKIDRDDAIPEKRKIKDYYIFYNARKYPPKYTISLANSYPNRAQLPHEEFHGGPESNCFLMSRGFEIRDRNGQGYSRRKCPK